MNWNNPFKTVTIKTIKPGDKMFKINTGFMTADRASIEIDRSCPSRYADIIAQCYSNGWIKPVAHVTEKEYTLMGLGN
jgi:hypothetical protein